MAPPKSYRDYASINACADSVLLKRGGLTGMDAAMKNIPENKDFLQCKDLTKEARKQRESEPQSRDTSLRL